MRSGFPAFILAIIAGAGLTACDSGQEPAPTVAGVVVTPATLSLSALADTARLTAHATDSRGREMAGAEFTWSSSAPGTASVGGSGLVTAVANGQAIISATSRTVSGNAQVTVAQRVAAITVTPAATSVDAVGRTVQLGAAARDANGHAIAGVAFSWTTSNAAVAVVSPTGLVTAVGSGTASISAAADGTSASAAVTVAQTTATLALTPATATLAALGAIVQLTAVPHDAFGHVIAGKRVTWASSAASVATVDTAGKVTAMANGAAAITALSDGVGATATVTVAQQLARVAITPAAASLGTLGRTVQLAATARDANGYAIAGKAFTWASASPGVVSVNSSGLVTAVANGSATVAATTEGLTGTSEITVAQKAATATLSPTGASLAGTGATRQFSVAARDSGGSAIPPAGVHATWTSLIPGIATVSSTGLAAAVGSGQTTIQMNLDGVTSYATLTVAIPGLAPVNLWARVESGIADRIEALWGTSASDIYATAHGSHVLHYDGSQWQHVFGGIPHGMAVWGSSARDVYALGDGKVAHFDGTLWSMVATGLCNNQSAAWGASPVDIFAVCWDGTIVHFDGSSWTRMTNPVADSRLYGVWGASADTVCAVGSYQLALCYDGSSWHQSASFQRHVEAVWGTSGSNRYATFAGNVFHYGGSHWTWLVYDAPMWIWGISGSSANDIYFVGADTLGRAAVLRYDGNQTWTLSRSPLAYGLTSIWVAPTGEVFAAGDGGTILRGYRNGTMGISPSVVTLSGANNRVRLTALPGAGGLQLSGVPISWSSFNPAVATVDDDGWVTGVTTGTAVISAVAFGGAGATANITVDLTKRPPVATIDSPSRDTTITRGEAVQFRGTASDADGTIATHAWDYGDGTTASVEDPPAHTYAAIGNYRVTYRVTDNDGMSSPAAAVTVTVVADQIPIVTITSPANGSTFAPGEMITFTGSATDHEDGTLTGASLVWTSSLDGQIGTGTSFTRNDLSLGTHRITLVATDSYGAGGSAEVTVNVTVVSPIATGEWHGSTTGMALDFNVSGNAQYVTQMKYTFSGLKCGGAELVSGSVTVSRTPGFEITNRQFTIPSSQNVPGVTGTFGDNGTTVSGTWTWLTCSGPWTGSH